MLPSEEAMQKAIEAVKSGMSKKLAAKQFGVARSTLRFRLSDKFNKVSRGPAPVLTFKEEDELQKWIEGRSRRGQHVTKLILKLSVQKFLKSTQRQNPFTNDMPGDGWYRAFLRRHPNVTIREAEEVTRSAACVKKEDIQKWFKVIETELDREGWRNILECPSRLFNADETGVPLNPTTGRVLAIRGSKHVYEVHKGIPKSNITVMCAFSALGDDVPPMLIFPYKARIPSEVTRSVPDAWGIGHSERGWMNSDLFYDYISEVFSPYLDQKGIERPVILFVDGHKSHETQQVSELCEKLKIVLITLYPNTTHITQPCDVGVFKPLKAAWKKASTLWNDEHEAEVLNKQYFAPVFESAWKEAIQPQTIRNAFKASGLFPWNAESIDFTKCIAKKPVNLESMTRYNTLDLPKFVEMMGSHIEDVRNATETSATGFVLLKRIYDSFSNEPEVNSSFLEEFDPVHTAPDADMTHLLPLPSPIPSITELQSTPRLLGRSDLEEFHPVPDANITDLLTFPSPIPSSTDLQSATPLPGSSGCGSSMSSYLTMPPTPKRKGRTIKRKPFVWTGGVAKEFLRKSAEEKQEKEEAVKERKRKREELRAEKEVKQQAKLMKRKKKMETSSESEDSEVSSGETEVSAEGFSSDELQRRVLEPAKKQVGEYVLFLYEREYFPGKIVKFTDEEVTISSMQRCGRLWKWPELRADELDYPWEAVVGHITEPIKTSKTRNVYSVPEMGRYEDF